MIKVLIFALVVNSNQFLNKRNISKICVNYKEVNKKKCYEE